LRYQESAQQAKDGTGPLEKIDSHKTYAFRRSACWFSRDQWLSEMALLILVVITRSIVVIMVKVIVVTSLVFHLSRDTETLILKFGIWL